MGRTKKKPGYDQNRIMEQFQNCIVEAYTSGMTDESSISLRCNLRRAAATGAFASGHSAEHNGHPY